MIFLIFLVALIYNTWFSDDVSILSKLRSNYYKNLKKIKQNTETIEKGEKLRYMLLFNHKFCIKYYLYLQNNFSVNLTFIIFFLKYRKILKQKYNQKLFHNFFLYYWILWFDYKKCSFNNLCILHFFTQFNLFLSQFSTRRKKRRFSEWFDNTAFLFKTRTWFQTIFRVSFFHTINPRQYVLDKTNEKNDELNFEISSLKKLYERNEKKLKKLKDYNNPMFKNFRNLFGISLCNSCTAKFHSFSLKKKNKNVCLFEKTSEKFSTYCSENSKDYFFLN